MIRRSGGIPISRKIDSESVSIEGYVAGHASDGTARTPFRFFFPYLDMYEDATGPRLSPTYAAIRACSIRSPSVPDLRPFTANSWMRARRRRMRSTLSCNLGTNGFRIRMYAQKMSGCWPERNDREEQKVISAGAWR